jgi:alpha-glucosidase
MGEDEDRVGAGRVAASPASKEKNQALVGGELRVCSPDGRIEVVFLLDEGVPRYAVSFGGRQVIRPSRLGFGFKGTGPLDRDLRIAASRHASFDETWIQPWGEAKEIRDHHNELCVDLWENSGARRRMRLVFRVFDDGLGLCYLLPEQTHLSELEISDERTEFALAGDHQAWWIPAYGKQRYEYLYRRSPISELGVVHTPLTMETEDGLFLSIHEAALTDYASMTLALSGDTTLKSDLIPWSDGIKVRGSTPLKTPWRTIQIAESPGELITSYLALNLNEPNRLGDVSWVHPGKYVGIWWAMHIRKSTFAPGPRHGATTENAKRHIDFAAEHGFAGVLVEGWNLGWEVFCQEMGSFSFIEPYEDFDLEEVAAYARARGVMLIGHHETGGDVAEYEQQMESSFRLYQGLGVDTVKTGYASNDPGIKRYDDSGEPAGVEWHHGQHMVRHYRRVVETAARHQIMLDVHEPVKDTGLRRTYPNMLTREGARGQEYNAWGRAGGNPPEHTTILPFTRMLAGPMDFTPGIFDLLFEDHQPANRVNTTLAKQLALYVVLYSPLQMAADLPENYEGHPAFQFIIDVPVDWGETRVLHGQIGDYVTIVRRERDGEEWYLGSITDEEGRILEAPLDFLDAGKTYVAEIYADAEDADWKHNPLPVEISQVLVDRNTTLKLRLAPGGGQAIRLSPASDEEAGRLARANL